MSQSPGADPRVARWALAAARQLEAGACLKTVAEGGLEILGGSYALAYWINRTGEDLECLAAVGVDDPEILRLELSVLDAGLIRHLAPAGATLLTNAGSLLHAGGTVGVQPLGPALLLPLTGGGSQVGVLLIIARAGETFAADTVASAAVFKNEVDPALANLRLIQSLKDLVIRDDTADCFNRRYFDHMLQDEIERARRFRSRLGLIFLDMDNLKDVNTLHGHAAGSRVLYEASVRVSRCIRSIDRLFRYGGDEFVVLLPNTAIHGAREVAERILREIACSPFEVKKGVFTPLTASAGVACYPEHGHGGREVVEAADAAMREIKELGKNAIGVAPTPPNPSPQE